MGYKKINMINSQRICKEFAKNSQRMHKYLYVYIKSCITSIHFIMLILSVFSLQFIEAKTVTLKGKVITIDVGHGGTR